MAGALKELTGLTSLDLVRHCEGEEGAGCVCKREKGFACLVSPVEAMRLC